MKRTITTLLALGMLALPATASAKGGCPSTIAKPGVRVSIVTWNEMEVTGWPRYPATIETAHGAVKVEPAPESHVYAFDEGFAESRSSTTVPVVFLKLHEDFWGVYYTEHVRISGPGTRYEPYQYNLDKPGEGVCGTSNGTLYHAGIWSAEVGKVWETP